MSRFSGPAAGSDPQACEFRSTTVGDVPFASPKTSSEFSYPFHQFVDATHLGSQLLLAHIVALLEVIDEVDAFLLSQLGAIGLEALHHSHLHRAAFIVVLSVDQRTGQVGEGRAEEGSLRESSVHHPKMHTKQKLIE